MKNQKIFYLIGKNIKNSRSPLIHNKLFELKEKHDYRYIIHEQNILPSLKDLVQDTKFGGMSMTMPYKKGYEGFQKVSNNIQLIYEGKIAQNLKIINTIVKYQSEGKITFKGYNTDIYGIQKTLEGLQSMKNVVMIGAGATAQTFCNYFQQSQKCSKIFILNRTQSKIQKLKQKYNKATNYSNYNKQQISLIVNSLPSDVLKQSIQVYVNLIQSLNMEPLTSFMDVNYKSKQKILQPLIEKQGIKVNGYSGLDMLIWQAIKQNQLFCQQISKNENIDAEFMLLKQICINSLNQP